MKCVWVNGTSSVSGVCTRGGAIQDGLGADTRIAAAFHTLTIPCYLGGICSLGNIYLFSEELCEISVLSLVLYGTE